MPLATHRLSITTSSLPPSLPPSTPSASTVPEIPARHEQQVSAFTPLSRAQANKSYQSPAPVDLRRFLPPQAKPTILNLEEIDGCSGEDMEKGPVGLLDGGVAGWEAYVQISGLGMLGK